MILVIQILVWVFYGYLIIGLCFAIWFVGKGAQIIDEGMKGTKWSLKLLLLPGSLLLWPILLKKISRSSGSNSQSSQNL